MGIPSGVLLTTQNKKDPIGYFSFLIFYMKVIMSNQSQPQTLVMAHTVK